MLVCYASLGLGLSVHHPLWPVAMPTLWLLWVIVVAWQPRVWLFSIPAALPAANLSPWTGWLLFDEFDLLVLGVLCALQGRSLLAQRPVQPPPESVAGPSYPTLIRLQWCVLVVGLILGWRGGEPTSAHLFASHHDAWWSLRASKSWAWALLLWPWIRAELQRSPEASLSLVGRGMLVGLAIVTTACLYERAAYPGLLDFQSHYRTTALFWEMHVGGAAIDSYLAAATPFAAWALWRAYERRRFLPWLLAGVFSVLVVYAGLTTFARGLYLAVTASMCFLAWALYKGRCIPGGRSAWQGWHREWRVPATAVLFSVVVAEIVAILDGGSLMSKRLEDSPSDLSSRLDHWKNGISLLKTPPEWGFGLGAGRFAAAYAKASPQQSFSGSLAWSENTQSPLPSERAHAAPGHRTEHRSGMAVLKGPDHHRHLGGLYALTQRLPLDSDGHYSIRVAARANQVSRLLIRVCERHLLYDGNCQSAVVQLVPSAHRWVVASSRLRGPVLDPGAWWTPRQAVLSIGVLTVQSRVELAQVQLFDPQGRDVLHNGDFSDQLSHWFPLAQRFFVPWHSDSLLIELLVERGLFGTLVFCALVAAAAHSLRVRRGTNPTLVPTILASIVGVLSVGLVSSVMDVPRVSFLVLFILFVALSVKDWRPSQNP